jgi:ribosomal protein S11
LDRNELTLAIAGALVAAVLVGWVLRSIFGRMNNAAGPRSIRRTADLAAQLHAAEEAQARAEARLASVETDFGGRLTEMQTELDAANRALERERDQTEQIRAAYRDAIEGHARSEA